MPVDMSSAAVELAEYGLFPVRLHTILPSGRCSCGSADCGGSAGKHPVSSQWAKSVTQDIDILCEQFGGDTEWNVGIVLGPAYGIPHDQAVIDIEDDTESGRLLAEQLFSGMVMPTYRSNKSIHRLFRWDPRLPDKAVFKWDGLEFRLGGPNKETQSAAPPSMHHSGRRYEWLPGLSITEVPIPTLTDELLQQINEFYLMYARGRTSPNGASGRKILAGKSKGKLTPGERHTHLLTWITARWRHVVRLEGLVGLEDQDVMDRTWMELCAINAWVCDPPKKEQELETLFWSTRDFMRSEVSSELLQKYGSQEPTGIVGPEDPEETTTTTDQTTGAEQAETEAAVESETADTYVVSTLHTFLRKNGIRLVPDDRFAPEQSSEERIDNLIADQWSVKVFAKQDEDMVELRLPAVPSPVVMPLAEFDKPASVSVAVHAESCGEVFLDQTFPGWSWKTIWLGSKNAKGNGITRGLREYLLNRSHVERSSERSQSATIEDLILQVAGPVDVLLAALDGYEQSSGHRYQGRLRVDPSGSLLLFAPPRETDTGWYRLGEKTLLCVRTSEIFAAYRSTYGHANITTNKFSEAMVDLGFRVSVKNLAKGMSGRWSVRPLE